MPAKKRYLLGYILCLIFVAAGCGKKPTSSKVKKETIPQQKFYNDDFLKDFSKGWIFAFLQSNTSDELKKMIEGNLGWQSFFDGKLTEAIDAFSMDKTPTSKTGLVRTLLQRARLYQESYNAALQYHMKFLSYRQKNTKLVNPSTYLIFYLGRIKMLSGDYPKAIADFSYFLQKKASIPFQIRARVLLGTAYYLNGNQEKASTLWEETRQEFGEDLNFKSEWGFAQGYLGLNLKKALIHTSNAWRTAQEQNIEDKNYYLFNLMYLKMLNGQIDEVREMAKNFPWRNQVFTERIDPRLTLRFYNPFHLSFLSRLDLAYCNSLLESDGIIAYHDYYLGNLYFLEGNFNACETALRTFIKNIQDLDPAATILSPLNTKNDFLLDAGFMLGTSFYLRQEVNEANRVWEETANSQPKNPLLLLYKSEIQARYQDQIKEAVKTAAQAIDVSQKLGNDLINQKLPMTIEKSETDLSQEDIQMLLEGKKELFHQFFHYYINQYSRRGSGVLLQSSDFLAGLQILAETTDEQLGYNISGQNQPQFLLNLARVYYSQNRYSEVVGIYFAMLKFYPELKQNYEIVKSIYATTTGRGEAPR